MKPSEMRKHQAELIDEVLERKGAEIARLRDSNSELRALVEYAATSSTVTTSINPGCFWCNHEKHTRGCPARKALKVKP